jgi:hypothetical protein
MARRMTRANDTGETQARSENGTKQSALRSREHEAAASAGNGTPPADLRSRIEKLAYELYQGRGCRHGDDLRDWFEAERLTLGSTQS